MFQNTIFKSSFARALWTLKSIVNSWVIFTSALVLSTSKMAVVKVTDDQYLNSRASTALSNNFSHFRKIVFCNANFHLLSAILTYGFTDVGDGYRRRNMFQWWIVTEFADRRISPLKQPLKSSLRKNHDKTSSHISSVWYKNKNNGICMQNNLNIVWKLCFAHLSPTFYIF